MFNRNIFFLKDNLSEMKDVNFFFFTKYHIVVFNVGIVFIVFVVKYLKWKSIVDLHFSIAAVRN